MGRPRAGAVEQVDALPAREARAIRRRCRSGPRGELVVTGEQVEKVAASEPRRPRDQNRPGHERF
jgi:hypothetical protein